MTILPQTIVHIIAQLRLGAGRVVADTAIEQARTEKRRVMVCISGDTDEYWRSDPALLAELTSAGVEVHRIGTFFRRRADLLHQSAAKLCELTADRKGLMVVHAHTAMAAAVGFWARPDALIATCHGWGMERPPEFDLQDSLAYQLCDAVLTYSRYWAERLKCEMAVPEAIIIPMGISFSRFGQKTKRVVRRGALRLGTVCELTHRKGVDILLQAMPPVWNVIENAELQVVGHGDAAVSLRELASQIDPGMKRITFHGPMSNPADLMRQWDVFVLPSRSDNLPVVLLEAMYCGLPVVATSVGGIPDLIAAAGSGLVAPPESYCALCDGILELARLDRVELRQIGLKGKRYVRRENDVRRAVRRLDRVYGKARRGRRVIHPHGETYFGATR